jgi:putative tryptophan/tyrosine transport system substrate-binding protein
MRRRDFIAGFGGAVAWPLTARAQQRRMQVGVLFLPPERFPPYFQLQYAAFRKGLSETGFVEGRNVAMEHGWREGILGTVADRLAQVAANLVRQRVDVIFAVGLEFTMAAKAATTTIPIVFFMGEDPVRHGFVASLNRPGGNATGYTNFGNQLIAKRLELLHQAVPNEMVIGYLVDPNNANADPDTKDAQAAALALGLALRPLTAARDGDLEQVFATIAQERIGAVLVGVGLFRSQPEKLPALAARHSIAALYEASPFTEAGGLMSYGIADPNEGMRQCGTYVGRILRGEKPADLPVVQPTKFDFVVNLKAAKALGLTIPLPLLAFADRVIE